MSGWESTPFGPGRPRCPEFADSDGRSGCRGSAPAPASPHHRRKDDGRRRRRPARGLRPGRTAGRLRPTARKSRWSAELRDALNKAPSTKKWAVICEIDVRRGRSVQDSNCILPTRMPTRDELLDLFRKSGALLEGHFRLSSGLHSTGYLQCALVLQHPEHAELLGRAIADRTRRARRHRRALSRAWRRDHRPRGGPRPWRPRAVRRAAGRRA